MCRGIGASLALLAIITSALAGQGAKTDAGRVVDGRLVSDTFEIHHQWQGDTLVLAIRSDLPDATTLMVSVDRFYWERGSSDTYSLPYLSQKTRIGAWEDRVHRVVIDDRFWRDSLQALQRQMARIGMPFQVRRIEDSIRVDFIVPVNQDDPRFGRGNSNLTGSAVRKSGLRVVNKEMALFNELGESPPPSRWASPQDLIVGTTYVLSAQAPLMPAFEPEDPLAAAASAVQMTAGTRITVKTVRMKGGTPWYRVLAVGPAGDAIGTGWINSTALLGMEIRREEH